MKTGYYYIYFFFAKSSFANFFFYFLTAKQEIVGEASNIKCMLDTYKTKGLAKDDIDLFDKEFEENCAKYLSSS